jgi:hypothetical protein
MLFLAVSIPITTIAVRIPQATPPYEKALRLPSLAYRVARRSQLLLLLLLIRCYLAFLCLDNLIEITYSFTTGIDSYETVYHIANVIKSIAIEACFGSIQPTVGGSVKEYK